MPAEAVHLSALADTLSDASIAVKRITDGPERLSATRLGAVMVAYGVVVLVVLRPLLVRRVRASMARAALMESSRYSIFFVWRPAPT